MKRLIGMAVLLAGCVSGSQRLQTELQPYVGHNVKELVAVLGYPGTQSEMLGDTLYIWSVDRHSSFSIPTVTTTQGQVGGTPYTATTTGSEDVPLHYQCRLTIATDAAGTIKNFSFQGNAGCGQFARALDR